MANEVQRELELIPDETQFDPLVFELNLREPHIAPTDHRIYYGSNFQQFGDLRLPKGPGPHPVAIVIHGGSWRSTVGLDYIAPVAAALTCAGVATWNIEYRRMGADGGWPGTFLDVASAADFLRELALMYPLDLTRVVAIGHSAGAHLSLWLAARDRLPRNAELFTPDPLPLSGVVSLDGPPDFARLVELVPKHRDTIVELLGGGTEEQIARRMTEASPVELLPLGEPQIFVNGEFDSGVPVQLITEYAQLAEELGDEVEVVVIGGAKHFESVDPAHPQAGPAIRDAVLSLMGL